MWLESSGHLEARPKSGFFVRRPFASLIPEPRFELARDPECVPFSAGCATPELFPNRAMNLILRRIVNRQPLHSARYEFPPGMETLRRQIARRSPDAGCGFAAEDIVVTCGALEAVNLSLRTVTKPGDVIAVESAIRKHRVKACVVMSNCHNPLGYVLPDKNKKALADLTARWNVAVIEDDVYGDLAYETLRPRTVKSFDRKDLVLLCSSFSKTLPPGYRVGWVMPGRFRAEVERLKFWVFGGICG